MNLKKKLLLIMLGAIIIPLIIGISMTYINIQKSLQSMEIENGKKNLKSVEAYLQLLIDNHNSGNLTWTLWNEYYNAVKNKNIYWINDNILSSVRENSNSEAIVVLNENKKSIASVNIPKDWRGIDFSNFSLMKNLKGQAWSSSGLISTSEGLFIATIVKLAKADDQEFINCNGFTIYARKIRDKGLLYTGKKLLGVKIAVQLDNRISISTDSDYSTTLKSSNGIKDSDLIATSKKSTKKIIVKTEKTLKDASGVNIGILSVETSNQTGKSALNQLLVSSAILIIILMVSVFIVTLVLINMFVKPIVFITKLMNKFSHGDIELTETEISTMHKYQKLKSS